MPAVPGDSAARVAAGVLERWYGDGWTMPVLEAAGGFRARTAAPGAAAFVSGVEALGLGILFEETVVARAGAALLCASAVLAATAAAHTWRRRPAR